MKPRNLNNMLRDFKGPAMDGDDAQGCFARDRLRYVQTLVEI